MFKNLLLLFIIIIISNNDLKAQYFQQDVAYKINGSIDSTHLIKATCDITYTNNSPSLLDTMFIHLWTNAFSDKLSAFSEQSIRTGDLSYYFADDEELGGYSDLIVSIGNNKMELYSWENNKDVVYFLPPKSIKPGENVTIKTSYKLQLPRKFSRTGWTTKDDYLMYWHPIPAVYDQSGWHPMPYLGMGEFYTEHADYDITLDIKNNSTSIISSTSPVQSNYEDQYKFSGKNLIDYAIITSNNKNVYGHQVQSISGTPIDIKIMTKHARRDSSAIIYLTEALAYFEKTIGPFPFQSLSVIDKGRKAKSGMEYPGLITVSGEDGEHGNFEYYIVHELLHQYFYGALAFNQRKYAWLDEGLTTYYQQRYYKEVLNHDHYSASTQKLMNEGQQPFLHSIVRTQACRHYHAPISMNVNDIDPINYGFNAYEVPARMYAYLQEYLETEIFDKGMESFYKEWKGKHPLPSDLRSALEEASNKDLAWFFEDLVEKDWTYDYEVKSFENGDLVVNHKSGSSPPYKITFKSEEGKLKSMWIDGHSGEQKHSAVGEQWTMAFLDEAGLSMDINTNNNTANVRRPLKLNVFPKIDDGRFRELYFNPTLSYNTSDGGMLGLALYNTTTHPHKLKWLVSPAFGTTSKNPVGEAWVSYDHYLQNSKFRKLQYKLNAKSYAYRYSETLESTLKYIRVSPVVSLHLQHNPKDNKSSVLYFKPIFLNEEFFDFQVEPFSIKNRNSIIFRLGFEHNNYWKLGPSNLNIQLEQQSYDNIVGENHNYTKLTAAYGKAFKYAPKRSVDFRLWGAYFLSNTQRESANYDGSITKGSAALIYQGFNDYAYDDYFFNRANQNVAFDNQISNAGGGFKTPFGSQYNLGQSNDLALALNVKSDLPVKMPKFLPLKLFLDIGYYTSKGAEEEDLKATTIYSGGVMLEYFDGLISFHIPLFNSDALTEIYDTEGTTLLGKVSFKMDLIKFNPWNIIEDRNF